MRGNKRLVQGIAVATMTGALVLTALPQQTITKTEETVQITQNATAGTSAMSDGYMSQIFSQAMSLEINDASPVMSTAVIGKPFNEKPAVIEHADSKEGKMKKQSAKKTASNKASEKKTDKKTTEKKSENKATEKKSDKKKSDKSESNKTAPDKDKTTSEKALESKATDASVKANKSEKTTKSLDSGSKEKDSKNSNEKKTVSAKASDTKKADSKKNTKKENTKKENDKDDKSSSKDKWENKLMADVDKSLNIRKSDDIDSQVLGKLRKGDTATVLKKGKKWTKIKSGDVVGYVKNSYCVYGEEAYKLAKKICHTYATVKTDGLRIRQKAHDEAIVLRAAEEGDKLVVNKDKKEKDGWVAVTVDDTKGYVSSDYVDVALGTGKAITIEEEQAQIAAQKKAEEAAQQTVSSNVSSASASTASTASAQVSSNDLTLLSAIIFCEAGGESYAGQVAVGAVVMNRLKSGSFPNTISGVVYQSGQFSPVANGALSRALANGNYANCTSAAQAALAGSDNTGGAKFFHRVNGDAGLVIGNHVFY